MRSFFKIFLASLLALIIFSVVSVFIFIAFLGSLASEEKPEIGRKGVLVLDLTEHFFERVPQNPLAELAGGIEDDIPNLYEAVRLIRHAKGDSAIRGIYIKCNDNANGFAASQELISALNDFKQGKKFVIAYGDVISQRAYYVATAADKIYCNPKGGVEWTGYAATIPFLKGTLDKLEIQPQIFYAGKFKSATEPLREYQMTEPNRIQTREFLNDLYGNFLVRAAAKTNRDTASLHRLANSGAIRTATDAVNNKIIDGVRYDDQVKSEIINHLNISATDKINFVPMGKYAKAIDFVGKGDRIAIVYAEGDIVDGKGGEEMVGSDQYKNLIRKLRLDKNVKAIVLRINSPGGSALASEVIWREIELAKKDKPVVVSLGDVAASGGYYIACNADSIFAQPNTITGSIGVFGVIPNMQSFFKNKLGVTFDGVKTGPFADFGSVSRPLTEAERSYVQEMVDTIYLDFKSRVAEGRKIAIGNVDSIAQGRVWTGQRALGLGLVDKLGNIQEAVNCAARMAKLKDYRVREYPEEKGFLETLLNDYKKEVKTNAIKEEVGVEQYDLMMKLKYIKRIVGIPQARLPYDIDIR